MEKKHKAVLALIIVVIVLVTAYALYEVLRPRTAYVPPTPPTMARSRCAAEGIELLEYPDEGYTQMQEANGSLKIKFDGKTFTCIQADGYCNSSISGCDWDIMEEPDAFCAVPFPQSETQEVRFEDYYCMGISVNTTYCMLNYVPLDTCNLG